MRQAMHQPLPDQPAPAATVRVWDRAVRGLHAALALGVIASWITGHWWHDTHEWLGYGVTAIVLARLVWGWNRRPASRHARFDRFVRGPRVTLAYGRAMLAGAAPRHLGHNPLGGWMVLALLACAGATTVTGILYTTDWLWGYDWLHDLHQTLAWCFLALVPLHVAGVILSSRLHRESLVAAMVHGHKRAAAAGEVAD